MPTEARRPSISGSPASGGSCCTSSLTSSQKPKSFGNTVLNDLPEASTKRVSGIARAAAQRRVARPGTSPTAVPDARRGRSGYTLKPVRITSIGDLGIVVDHERAPDDGDAVSCASGRRGSRCPAAARRSRARPAGTGRPRRDQGQAARCRSPSGTTCRRPWPGSRTAPRATARRPPSVRRDRSMNPQK